jgi:hypothetical protein
MEMLFVSAFGLSLALWAVPGAVTTEALRRGLTRRWWSVSFILLGTLAGNALWASVSFLFANILARNTLAHGLLGALETIVLLSLAWGSLKAGWSKRQAAARETPIHGDVATGALLSRLEPLYDHVLAWGQWDGLGSERFEHTGARHGCLFHTVSAGRCSVGTVPVRCGAGWTLVRMPATFPLDEHWVRPGAWQLWPSSVGRPARPTQGIVDDQLGLSQVSRHLRGRTYFLLVQERRRTIHGRRNAQQ